MSNGVRRTFATRIEGTVTRSDGAVVHFAIGPDLGWQQWGAQQEQLGANVDVMDAMVAGLSDGGVEPRHEPEEGEPDHDHTPDAVDVTDPEATESRCVDCGAPLAWRDGEWVAVETETEES